MGRLTNNSPRCRLHETMRSLNRKYRAALKEEENKATFNAMYQEWPNEDAAAIYQFGDAGVYSPLDLINLNSTILNRREIIKLVMETRELREIVERSVRKSDP